MLKKFLTQSAGYGVAEIGRQAVGLLLLPIYARCLSPNDYGIVSVLAVRARLQAGLFSLQGVSCQGEFMLEFGQQRGTALQGSPAGPQLQLGRNGG